MVEKDVETFSVKTMIDNKWVELDRESGNFF
jgi:hypothetical protein